MPTLPMDGIESLHWSMERHPRLRTGVAAIVMLEDQPDLDQLHDRMAELAAHVPMLRSSATGRPHPFAVRRWHRHDRAEQSEHVVVKPAADHPDGLAGIVASMMEAPYRNGLPPWEMTVVTDLPEGGAALVMRMHHSVTDGVGAVLMAARFFEADAAGTRLVPDDDAPPPAGPGPSLVADLAATVVEDAGTLLGLGTGVAVTVPRRVAAAMRHPVSTVTRGGALASSMTRVFAPAPTPLSPVMRGHTGSVRIAMLRLPLSDLKTAARNNSASVNDVFLAALSLGLHAYHEALGDRPVPQLRVGMPINARTGASQAGGNHIQAASIVLPLEGDDVARSVQSARHAAAAAMGEPALWMTPIVARGFGRLPAPVAAKVCEGIFFGIDFVASNVPGPPVPLWFAGRRVTGMWAVAPRTGSAFSATLISYHGDATVTLNMDRGAVRDPDLLVSSLRDGFARVASVGKPSAGRSVGLPLPDSPNGSRHPA